MSTDLYGARVIAIAPEERRVRFRIFVVYYDTAAKYHQPLPDDASFFFRLLAETSDRRYKFGGPLGDQITMEESLDERWVEANTWRFVERFELLSAKNDALQPDDFARYQDFYYERQGRWADEDQLVQADYDVFVTDARWIEQLTLGQSWGTTSYSRWSDRLSADDLRHIPSWDDAKVLRSFDGKATEAGTPGDLAFSDDTRYLAVMSDAAELVVYDTRDWSECMRHQTQCGLFAKAKWVPNRHVITVSPSDFNNTASRWAFDLDAKIAVDVPLEFSESSRNSDEPDALAPEWVKAMVSNRIWALTESPDGAYLVLADGPDVVCVFATRDRRMLVRRTLASFVRPLSWSKDALWLAANVIDGADGYGGETRVFRIGCPVPELKEIAPRQKPSEDDGEPIRSELIHELAASATIDADEWERIKIDHTKWLASGGGAGDGAWPESHYAESPWQLMNAAGLILAVYTGPNGSEGAQAVLRTRNLGKLDLRGLSFAWSDLTGTVGDALDLEGADLHGSTATEGRWPKANFRNADLRVTDFSRTDLSGADFRGAKLEGADFEGADLSGADFTGARIGGIKLKGAKLTDIRGFGTLS